MQKHGEEKAMAVGCGQHRTFLIASLWRANSRERWDCLSWDSKVGGTSGTLSSQWFFPGRNHASLPDAQYLSSSGLGQRLLWSPSSALAVSLMRTLVAIRWLLAVLLTLEPHPAD